MNKRIQDDNELEERNPRKVASHYNNRPQVGVEARKESPIFHLKAFNNWIKSILIKKFARRGDRVLDLACGKGGDLLKWQKASISSLYGLDIAQVSIGHAEERYKSGRSITFSAEFKTVDCFGV